MINRDTKKLFDLYNQFKNNAVFVPLFLLSYNERSKLITKLKFIVYRIVNTFFPKKLNVFSIFTLTNYQSLIRLLLSSNYLISGRFHMIALSLIYKVPFNYTSSNTYKIEGLLKDIGISGRKINLALKYKLNIKKFTKFESNLIKIYLNKAPIKIDKMFEEIINDKK